MSEQLALFAQPAQRRAARRESPDLYGLILRLRHAGLRVYRRGRHHLVGQRQMTTREVRRCCRAMLNGVVAR